jgi:sulfite exporter TauE/SafE
VTPSGWLLAAGLTAAASVHCVGMCGPFVLAVAVRDRERRWRLAGNQILLQLGKATTYAFLGALAGLVGGAVVHSRALTWAGQGLALATAVALALAGLTLLGLRSGRPGAWVVQVAALGKKLINPLLAERPAGSALVVGMALGALPCPLVYAGLALAATSGSPALGAATLAGVALGTVPALAAVALLGVALPQGARLKLARAGGVLLLAMAAVTLFRAVGHDHGGHAGHAAHEMPAAEAPAGLEHHHH